MSELALLVGALGCGETAPAPPGSISVALTAEPSSAEPGDTIRVTVRAEPAGGAVVEVIHLVASGLVASSDSARFAGTGSQSYTRAYALPFQPATGTLSLVAAAAGGDASGSAEATVLVADSEPPTVSSATATPSAVQPGDSITVSYTAVDGAGLAWTVVHVSGAVTATDSTTDGYARSVSRSVKFAVPPTAPMGASVGVWVVAADIAGQRDSAAAAAVQVTDLTPPTFTRAQVWGPDVTPTFLLGDTLHVAVRATDNQKVAWLGYRLGPPASVQESVATAASTATTGFARPVQADWAGTLIVAAFARDSVGNLADTSLGTVAVLNAVRVPPAIPPSASADVDPSFFLQPLQSDDNAGNNYWSAGGLVSDTRSVTEPLFTIPRVVLQDAPLYAPAMAGGVWHWRFTTQVGGAYQVDLTGRVEGDSVVWAAWITAVSHGVYNALWFDGASRTDGTAGFWRMYPVQGNPTPVLGRIDWTHPGPALWTLSLAEYGGLQLGGTHQGTYTVNGTDRLLDWTTVWSSGSNSFQFQAGWDLAGRDGFVIAPAYNGGARACWGSHLENVVCPP